MALDPHVAFDETVAHLPASSRVNCGSSASVWATDPSAQSRRAPKAVAGSSVAKDSPVFLMTLSDTVENVRRASVQMP